jgi:hypothetical protein
MRPGRVVAAARVGNRSVAREGGDASGSSVFFRYPMVGFSSLILLLWAPVISWLNVDLWSDAFSKEDV